MPQPFVPPSVLSAFRYAPLVNVPLRSMSHSTGYFVQLSVFEVTSEFWINSLHGRVLLGLRLLDSVSVGLLVLVVVGVVL